MLVRLNPHEPVYSTTYLLEPVGPVLDARIGTPRRIRISSASTATERPKARNHAPSIRVNPDLSTVGR
jgi:hypothetical protein